MSKSITAEQLISTLPEGLLTHLSGDLSSPVQTISSLESSTPQSLCFVHSERFLSPALESQAGVLIVPNKLSMSDSKDKCVLTTPSTRLALALISKHLFPVTEPKQPVDGQRIHPSAVVSASAKLGNNVQIGPNATIGNNVTIGDNCFIGANSVIETAAQLGQDCHIHPLVFIGHSCQLGDRVEVQPQSSVGTEGFGYADDAEFNHYRIHHYGIVELHDDVHIGAGVNIDRGTFENSVFGKGTKVDNHCHFAHNFKIGKNAYITAGFISAGSVTFGDNIVVGGRTTVNGHINVTSNVQIGPMSGVVGNVTEPGQYQGFPLQTFAEGRKTIAMFRRLPEMYMNLKKVMKKLDM